MTEKTTSPGSDRPTHTEEAAPGHSAPQGCAAAPCGTTSSGIDFSAFILSLAQSAMIDLAMVPHPETGQLDKNLKAACHTIDIIGMLSEKTRGNLTAGEQRLLDGTLYQLRLSFVQAKKGGVG